jgi:signal transduction histidine kinase
MDHSYRLRLLTSFILPIIVFIPLIGFALIYLLAYQVFYPALANEMITEGNILAQEFRDNPLILKNRAAAQDFVDRLLLPGSLSIELIDAQGRILTTNQSEENSVTGNQNPNEHGTGELPPTGKWAINRSSSNNPPTLDVTVPLLNSQNQPVGQLRLSRRLTDIDQGLRQAWDWIIVALLIGILVYIILGLKLSARLTQPLHRITQAIMISSLEGRPKQIQEKGYSEVDALAQAFNQLQERRYEIESTRKQMLANLVHELSRPLGSLQVAAHALLSGAESNASLRLDLLHGMAERIEWLGHLVNDLALAYLPERALELRMVPFEPCAWLKSLIPIWAELARHREIEWHSVWEEEMPMVEGDPARLEQALDNLVSNAIKFTQPGGKVSLTAGVDSEQFWVSVADNGPGISADDLQHLFDPFFRAEGTALKAPGLGLGLSIARTIVEAHGGSIQVQSRYGEGSQFTLCVPYHSG